MSKIELTTLNTGNSVTTLNNNFQKIEDALNDKVLYRDPGIEPNHMLDDLDMNSKEVYNAKAVRTQKLFLNGSEVETSELFEIPSTIKTFEFTAGAGQTDYNISPYTPLDENTEVYVDGEYQLPSLVSVSGSTITIPVATGGESVVVKIYLREIGAGGELAAFTFIQEGAGAFPRTALDKLRDVKDARDFGVVGDGVVDDTAALQSAINASYGCKLVIPEGTYKITSSLAITDSIEIEGQGKVIINGSSLPVGASLNQIRAIHVYGTAETEVAISADIPKGSFAVSADTTGLVAGDMVIVRSDELIYDGYGNAASKRGQLSEVASIDSGSTLTLRSAADFTYTSAQNARLQKINPVEKVVLRNLEIQMKGYISVHGGIKIDYARDFLLDRIICRGVEDHGIATWYSMYGVIDNCHVYDATSANVWNPSLNTGYGYVFYNASRNIILQNSHAHNCRRANTGGNELPATFITVKDNSATNCLNAWGTHEPCFNWLIEGNYGSGLSGIFMTVRGSKIMVRNNRCLGSAGNGGIRVRTYYDTPEGISHIHLIDNHLENTGGPGIWLEGIDIANQAETGGPVSEVVIRGGSIINPDTDGIYIERSNNVLIEGVLFDGVQNALATDGNGVYINGDSTAWNRSSIVTIRGCTFRNMLRNAVRADYCSSLTIQDCKMNSFVNNTTATNAVYAYEVDNLQLLDNEIDMRVGYYGYYLSNCDDVKIDGGVILGGSGLISQDLILIDHDAGAGGSRNENVSINGTKLSGSNRYGLFVRYCKDVSVKNTHSRDCGTYLFSNCDFVEASSNRVTVNTGQIYNFRVENCTRLLAQTNYFYPGAAGQAGVFCTRTSGKMEIAQIVNNSFGAFTSGTGVILQDVNYPIVTSNNFISVVGGNKVSITGALNIVVSDNQPGSTGLWKTDVNAASFTAVSGMHCMIFFANTTTIVLPASPFIQSRIQITVCNGRIDNIVDRNGNNIMGLAENMTLDSVYDSVTLEFIGGSTGWRIVR